MGWNGPLISWKEESGCVLLHYWSQHHLKGIALQWGLHKQAPLRLLLSQWTRLTGTSTQTRELSKYLQHNYSTLGKISSKGFDRSWCNIKCNCWFMLTKIITIFQLSNIFTFSSLSFSHHPFPWLEKKIIQCLED